MIDQVAVQEWQPFFMALASAAALAGLMFVATSPAPSRLTPLPAPT